MSRMSSSSLWWVPIVLTVAFLTLGLPGPVFLLLSVAFGALTGFAASTIQAERGDL